MAEDNAWLRRIDREKTARNEAEELLEAKSLELFQINEELIKARESLEQQVLERTEELSRAVEKLQEEIGRRKKVEDELRESRDSAVAIGNMKSEFLARMSHEIRTPMNAVLGLTDIVLRSRLNEEQRYQLGMVQDSGQMLLRIINDILDQSKIDADKMELDYTRTSLRSVIDQSVSQVSLEADKKDMEFEVTNQHKSPDSFFIDSGRLQQIMLNLVSNAVKYSDGGTVRIKTRILPVSGEPENLPKSLGDIKQAQELSLSRLQITVTDEGRGMLPEHIETLFEPFNNHNSTSVGSTGLGLSICKRLCELMGGGIQVESTYGKGSTFLVEILCGTDSNAQGEMGVHAQTSTAATVATGDIETEVLEETVDRNTNAIGRDKPLSILLADDFEVNRLVQLAQLEILGYHADIVTNGEEVIRALKVRPYDVVLMDIRMPVLDGVATTERIRKSEDLPNPFIIAVTASALEEDQRIFTEAGIDAYVPKPVEIDQLRIALGQAYTSKQQCREKTEIAPQEGSAISVINMEALYERLGPAAGKLMIQVIPVYIREMPAREESLWESYQAGDVEAFGRLCHGLKGASRSVGVDALADAFGKLEKESYDGQLPTRKVLDSVLRLTATVIRGLKQQISLLEQENS